MDVQNHDVGGAFFRLEGVLLARPPALAAAWLAANAQHLGQRAIRLSTVALSAPFALGLGEAAVGHRLAWAAVRGMSADRIAILGEEYAQVHLLPNLRAIGIDLWERARRDGCPRVLVSDLVEDVVGPIARHLGADHTVCNTLEFRNGRATGRLEDPVVTRFGGTRLQEFASREGIGMARSRAYGASAADQVLLSSVSLPCAVFPDRTLRRVAVDLDWPVVESP